MEISRVPAPNRDGEKPPTPKRRPERRRPRTASQDVVPETPPDAPDEPGEPVHRIDLTA